jgi:type I restriction enzyme, S subunit
MNSVPFYEALEDCSRLAGKVPQASCLPNGEIPVIGQGKRPVEGFTNDYGLLFSGDLPVILFGDHTATFKFIDHPFARGADGTKLFRPRDQRLNAKYAWHFLQTVRLPQTGYDRKTKYLEDIEIPLPSLEEQRRIAAILDKASMIKRQSAKASVLAETLCIARLEQLLGTNKDLLVGRRLEELCVLGAPITYGILQPGPDLEEGVPYVRPSEIKNSQIDLIRLKKTSTEIADKYSKSELKAGDLLLTIVGTIGETAVVPPALAGGNITQSSARIRVEPDLASPTFVYYFLKSQHAKRQIERDRLGVAVERLNLHHVRDMEILCLPRKIQENFATDADSLKLLASRQSLLSSQASSLFESLSHSFLAGSQES